MDSLTKEGEDNAKKISDYETRLNQSLQLAEGFKVKATALDEQNTKKTEEIEQLQVSLLY